MPAVNFSDQLMRICACNWNIHTNSTQIPRVSDNLIITICSPVLLLNFWKSQKPHTLLFTLVEKNYLLSQNQTIFYVIPTFSIRSWSKWYNFSIDLFPLPFVEFNDSIERWGHHFRFSISFFECGDAIMINTYSAYGSVVSRAVFVL